MAKAPTVKDLQTDIRWTKKYIKAIWEAKQAGDFATAAEIANEISAIWGTISGNFEDAETGRWTLVIDSE